MILIYIIWNDDVEMTNDDVEVPSKRARTQGHKEMNNMDRDRQNAIRSISHRQTIPMVEIITITTTIGLVVVIIIVTAMEVGFLGILVVVMSLVPQVLRTMLSQSVQM